jgi:integrase
LKGTTIKYQPAKGKPTFGYSFFAGRDEAGKRVQKVKRGFSTKAEAEEALRLAIADHQKMPVPTEDRAMPTFAEFFERWHREYAALHCAPKTSERYLELGHIASRYFGDQPLDCLDTMQLQEAFNQLLARGGRKTKPYPQGRPLSAKTVVHIQNVVQKCVDLAVDWNIITRNPMLKVRKPKLVKKKPRVLDAQALAGFLASIRDRRIYPVVALAAATGMRRGELLALEWSDIHWDTGIVEVSKSLEETKQGLRIKPPKSGVDRRFALPKSILRILGEHRARQAAEHELYGADYPYRHLVFSREDGGGYYSPDKIGTRISVAMRQAGIPASLHALRHSHASQLLSTGAPITVVSERLGHASPQITLSIYSHALPMDNQAAAALWDDAVGHVLDNVKSGMSSNVIKTARAKTVIPIKSAS